MFMGGRELLFQYHTCIHHSFLVKGTQTRTLPHINSSKMVLSSNTTWTHQNLWTVIAYIFIYLYIHTSINIHLSRSAFWIFHMSDSRILGYSTLPRFPVKFSIIQNSTLMKMIYGWVESSVFSRPSSSPKLTETNGTRKTKLRQWLIPTMIDFLWHTAPELMLPQIAKFPF